MNEVHPSAIIRPGALIGENVKIGPNCIIGENVRIGDGTIVLGNVVIDGNSLIGEENLIYWGAVIGSPPQDLKFKGEKTKLTIGNGNVIREFATINVGTKGGGGETVVGDNNLIMAYCHLAHDCKLGNNVIMANGATLGGHVVLEDRVVLSGLTGVHHFVRIGSIAIVGGASKVLSDIPPYCSADGHPARVRGLNIIGLRRNNIPDEARKKLKSCYRLLYRSGLNMAQAIRKIEEEIPTSSEVSHLLEFLKEAREGTSGRALQPKL